MHVQVSFKKCRAEILEENCNYPGIKNKGRGHWQKIDLGVGI